MKQRYFSKRKFLKDCRLNGDTYRYTWCNDADGHPVKDGIVIGTNGVSYLSHPDWETTYVRKSRRENK